MIWRPSAGLFWEKASGFEESMKYKKLTNAQRSGLNQASCSQRQHQNAAILASTVRARTADPKPALYAMVVANDQSRERVCWFPSAA